MTILVAGSHGFIGFSVARRLLEDGHAVIGVDKMRDAISKKGARVQLLQRYPQYRFIDLNLSDIDAVRDVFQRERFEHAVFLAGQYSQPHSPTHVQACLDGNVIGLTNFFQALAEKGLKRVLYASSTFVQDGVLPATMYGATKQWAELCASVYSAQFGMDTIGFRFGSVYGPFVRPDVGVASVARHVMGKLPIDISKGGFNYKVAFVYIDDAVECIVRAFTQPLTKRYQVLTIVAEDETRDMYQVLTTMEKQVGWRLERRGKRATEQQGVVPTVMCEATRAALGYAPITTMEQGMKPLVEWYAKCFG